LPRKEAILSAARITGADAIHSGLGFLPEDADFAALFEELVSTSSARPPSTSG
jgi:acetyl/propionyl-CoA carboxylase alpha subunit